MATLVISVAEFVVRRGLEADKAFIMGPAKVKMSKPSLHVIYSAFYAVESTEIVIGGKVHSGLSHPLRDNIKTIMKYFGIPETIFIRGCG